MDSSSLPTPNIDTLPVRSLEQSSGLLARPALPRALTPPVLPPTLPPTDLEPIDLELIDPEPTAPETESSPQATSPDPIPDVELPPSDACPRCQSKLIDPQGLGWCRGCGYCRSLEEDKAALAPTASVAPRESLLGLVELGELLALLPSWFWTLLGGIVTIVLLTLPPALVLPQEGLARALWCTLQIAVGLLIILAAQGWALMMIAAEDERLSGKDLVFSFRLWSLAFARLPRLRCPVWLGVWGIATILSAIFLVGGLTHWFEYLPRRTPPVEAVETQPPE
jgi:hypothetical protein